MFNGLKSGLSYIVTFFRYVIEAADTKNVSLLMTLADIAKIFLSDMKVKPGTLQIGLSTGDIFGDPFKASRAAMQALTAKIGPPK